MSHIPLKFALSVIASLAVHAEGCRAAQTVRNDGADLPARHELNQRFDLPRGATVIVRGIAGPVSVEAAAGDTADVRIVRTAATARELECYRTGVRREAGNLVIEHVQYSARPGCETIRARQTVRLRLPRSANLSLSTIGGRVDIGERDGLVKLESIAGHVTVAGARNVEMSSLAQGLSLTFARQGPASVRVSSVVGRVELSFQPGANADVQLSSVQGRIESDWPILRNDGALTYRVGSGGPALSVSSILGAVTLRRL